MIPPGGRIGIVGGGQLGRMMAIAAAQMGYHVHIFTPEAGSPAAEVAAETTMADYTDLASLKAFAGSVDVVTFEFENIPHASLATLEEVVPVCPSPSLLEMTQNRIREKTFVNKLGIATAPFQRVTSDAELREALAAIGLPAVLKTTEMGYDGKGQVMLREESEIDGAWDALSTDEAILEGFVSFSMEISVIVARNASGAVAMYPPVQNVHKHHILHETIVPAPVDPAVKAKALAMAKHIAEEAGLIGLLAIEMFVTAEGDVLVNELAPRPHNSGHWSIDAAYTSQFEQAIRAICDLTLGNPEPRCVARMLNLIGEDVEKWQEFTDDPNARLHLYGKREIRQGRKMGHVTFLTDA